MAHSGKEAQEFMEEVVYTHLGSASKRILAGPGKGLDNGIISVGNGKVMILTVDPISAIPAFGMKMSARLSVHLIASDYTASGMDPEFAVFAYNFPPSMSASDRKDYVRSIGAECGKLGISIAAGHTGSYPGAGFTVIGAGVMLGLAREGGYVTPSMARVGDSILVTKHAAIEATGSLALAFPSFVEQKVGPVLAARARAVIRLCSTVNDAQVARKVGLGREGVTSMHDATEGGVLGALEEMASASRKAFEVDVNKIPVPEEAARVCSAFGLNPLATMGEGALLITCRPERVPELERTISRAGIRVTEIGAVKPGEGLLIKHRGKRARKFRPGHDKYWSAYDKAT